MNTPKRLLSASDELSEFSTPTTRHRSRSPNQSLTTPIDDQIEQVAKRHRVPSDTVKRIVSDLLTEPSVVDYLRSSLNQTNCSTSSNNNQIESSAQRHFLFSPSNDPLTTSNNVVDQSDPLWLEFIQSLNSTDNRQQTEIHRSHSLDNFDSLFNDDEDDEEFVGPEDEIPIDQMDPKKLRVSKRELALLLKESNASPNELIPKSNDDNFIVGDQYESLWTDFLTSLQCENTRSIDEQAKSVVTTTTEEDDNDDDPEFRLPESEFDLEDDLDDELHVSRRELALLLEDNASILRSDAISSVDIPSSISENSSIHPESIEISTIEHKISEEQRQILQYQLTAFIQLLTQYILLRRETDPASEDCQKAQNFFKEFIFIRDKQRNSILSFPLVHEAQRLIESSPSAAHRKSFANHLPFHLMETFCKSPSFLYESLLPTCLLSCSRSSTNVDGKSRNFVSGEDCLIGLGLEQNDSKLFIVGHDQKSINDRINSVRYVRVRRGKENPIRAFFTYRSVPDASLAPWYNPPVDFDCRLIYPDGLISKPKVIFPSWFRLSYKRSRQLTKNRNSTLKTSNQKSKDFSQQNESPSSSTVYVVVEGTTPTARTTSPKKVLQQIHMLHLLNSYPKLQPRQT